MSLINMKQSLRISPQEFFYKHLIKIQTKNSEKNVTI